jgi:hypothetical protein
MKVRWAAETSVSNTENVVPVVIDLEETSKGEND